MFSSNSPSTTLSKRFWVVFVAALTLLLIAAALNVLGATLILIATLTVVLGIIAVARGQLHRLNISNRRTGTVVLLFGAYLMVLGGVTSFTTDDEIPTAVAAGDTCELPGSISEADSGTFYCTPADSNELIWASAADFTAHQKAEAQKLEEAAEEKAEAAAEEYEKEIAAAEERAETAETELQDYKDEAKAKAEADAKAKEEEQAEQEAAAAKAEEEEQERQRQQEAAQNTPAPVPAPQTNQNGDSSFQYENCDAARAAGAAPVHRGDYGFGPHLDRDNDGIGCE